MSKLTPALAKLIVLKSLRESCNKAITVWQETGPNDEKLGITEVEKEMMQTAYKNQIEILDSNIKYQEKVIG